MSKVTKVDPKTGTALVICECGWSNEGRLIMVDRYITDHPPIPTRGTMIELYLDHVCDPDDRVSACPECGNALDETTVLGPVARAACNCQSVLGDHARTCPVYREARA